MRQIACHEACKNPANVTLNHKFSRIGLDALDMCEVLIGCEREFDLEIAEENCEEEIRQLEQEHETNV